MGRFQRQRGLSLLGILLLLIALGFVLLCFFRLSPAYLDNMYVRDALKSLAEDHPDDLANLTKGEVAQILSNYYTINNVRGEPAKALEVIRRADKILIQVNYEVRVPLVANVDAVMKFENVLDSSRPEQCCSPEK